MNTVFKIEGMSCGHCVDRVTKALNGLPGVNFVEVVLENGTADIDFNEQEITRDQLAEIIENVGFDVVG